MTPDYAARAEFWLNAELVCNIGMHACAVALLLLIAWMVRKGSNDGDSF